MLCGDQARLHAMWIAGSTGFKTSIKRLPGTYAETRPMVHPTILGTLSENVPFKFSRHAETEAGIHLMTDCTMGPSHGLTPQSCVSIGLPTLQT